MQRVITITPDTKPNDIISAAQEHYNEKIDYQQAFRCLRILNSHVKEAGHRNRIPDELRKAIVSLRVFNNPPMDWIEIERRTGVKARTAGYIFQSAEKKSGGSSDPLVLLKNATALPGGPRNLKYPELSRKVEKAKARGVKQSMFLEFPSSGDILTKGQLGEIIPLAKPKRGRKPKASKAQEAESFAAQLENAIAAAAAATTTTTAEAEMVEPETPRVTWRRQKEGRSILPELQDEEFEEEEDDEVMLLTMED
jgi:hypothetical protein